VSQPNPTPRGQLKLTEVDHEQRAGCRWRGVCLAMMAHEDGFHCRACDVHEPLSADVRRDQAPALVVLAHLATCSEAELVALGATFHKEAPSDRRRERASQGGNEAGQETGPQIEACGHVGAA